MTFDETKEDALSIAFGFSNLSHVESNGTTYTYSGLTEADNCTGCLNELCIPEADYEVYRSV